MIRTTLAAVLLSAAALPVALAGGPVKIPKTQFSMEHCMNAALAARAGEVQALEMELNNGVPVYEFTLKASDDTQWEITCNAMTGKVIVQEQEIEEPEGAAQAKTDEAFAKSARITEAEARAVALNAHPGTIDEDDVERKMSSANVPIYEFEIDMADGTEREVEVDAVTGLIVGVEDEIYAIGDD